jgi:bifunctional DNA-binding transcriptional regulator/antitoxin component of YhaV-PrlF toxin-antitoxin module
MTLTHHDMVTLTKGLPSKAEKIRALAARGTPRADIARFLGVRYQQVRNVLVRSERTDPSSWPRTTSMAGAEKVRIDANGKLELPRLLLDALDLKDGDVLLARVDQEGELQLRTVAAAVRTAQAIVRRFVPEGVSLVDELIEDRQREAEAVSRDDPSAS